MIFLNISERWYIFRTSGSETTWISGSCNDVTHSSIAYQGHHSALYNLVSYLMNTFELYI